MSKVVIIGSGLGGLTCGYILLKGGYDVTILEQGTQLGGCLQCFTRKGAKFETGMHFIGSALPGQTMHMMMQYFGLLEDVPLSRLDPDGYNTVSLNGEEFRFPNGRGEFLERMGNYFPRERSGLEKYVDIIREVAQFYSLPVLDLFAMGGIQPIVETNRQKYCPDGLHPNDAGNRLIADRLVGLLRTL